MCTLRPKYIHQTLIRDRHPPSAFRRDTSRSARVYRYYRTSVSVAIPRTLCAKLTTVLQGNGGIGRSRASSRPILGLLEPRGGNRAGIRDQGRRVSSRRRELVILLRRSLSAGACDYFDMHSAMSL